MAGRILDEDVATVRERSRIEEVIGAQVMLKNGGGGSLVGLCPFHDEKTPSFRVTPSRGFYYCFGCGEGGDVIGFVQKMDNLSFVEAVTYLADKYGVQLRYTEDSGPKIEPGLRVRILEANQAAAEFFSSQLLTPDAIMARQFLFDRGFSREHAEIFGLGFAPRDGKALGRHLRGLGFSDEVLVRAGLIRESGWDFFQSRLLWPIRDAGRSVLGFGARRLFDDDRMPAKYINTPETPVYKKSQVLYGLDLARRPIGTKNQVVIVEGYTDVMAAHIAGVDTAVASCGTAFGTDHARLLSRLMGGDSFTGEVIFTFDGDAAGQAAAIKAFDGDAHFASQTYVAVEPTGLDPCDLRIQHGDAAVRELVGRREPLYRFVMRNVVSGYDLDRADGRLAAVRAAAPLVDSIRDKSLLDGFLRELSGLVGVDLETVRKEVRPRRRGDGRTARPQPNEPEKAPTMPVPDPRDPRLTSERGTLQLMVQHPECFAADWYGVTVSDFQHPAYAALFAAIATARDKLGNRNRWEQTVAGEVSNPVVEQVLISVAVENLLREASATYAQEYAASLRLRRLSGLIDDLRSKLHRMNPITEADSFQALFGELMSLEAERKRLRQTCVGLD